MRQVADTMNTGIELPIHILLVTVLASWIAVMVQRGIAVFHDGLRHKMGDFVSGTTTRDDLIQTGNRLNQSFAIWFIPFTLATGTILTHLLLLPLDLLGIRSQKWWSAAFLGGIWGGLLSIAVMAGHNLLEVLPININSMLIRSFEPLIAGMAVIPVAAVAYQFGKVSGILSLTAVLVAYIAAIASGITDAGATGSLTMLVALLSLVVFAFRAERKRRSEDETPIDMSFIQPKSARIREHSLWFAVLGALMGTAVNTGLFGWYAHDMLARSSGFQLQAVLTALMISIGFLPTVISSAAMTGVSQMVGLTLVFAFSYLAPHPIAAAAIGALIMLLEVRFLETVNHFINQAPTIREVGDSVRGAFNQISSILLIAGAFAASAGVMPGGGGYLIVGGIISVNEMTGTPISRMAIAPISVLILGIAANGLRLAGVTG